MNLTNEERNALVSIRMQKAKDTLLETKGILGLGYWRAAANRLYYACFYAASALLIKNGHSAHTHAGVINLIGLHFVKTGIFSKEQGKFYGKLFELRQNGDYDDWLIIESEDVVPLLIPAEEYIALIEHLILIKED